MHELNRTRVIVARSSDQVALLQHLHNDFTTYRSSNNSERPVTVFTDAPGRNVSMFCSEIGAIITTLSSPGVAFLQINFVVAAIVGPNLEDTFNVRLFYRPTIEAVFLFK